MVFAGITSARYAAPRSAAPQDNSAPYRHGDNVRHPKFGEGCVMMIEGSGDHTRVLVNFSDAGEKWLVLAYARLEKC